MSDRKYDPRGRIEISLDVHHEASNGDRPVFIYHRLSTAKYDELCDAFDSVQLPEDATVDQAKEIFKQRRDQFITVAGLGLIDWRNQVDLETGESLPFSPGDLPRVINPVEAREVIEKRIAGARLSPDDKKKLD